MFALLLAATCGPTVPPEALAPPRAERVVVVAPLDQPTNLSFEEGFEGWYVGGPVGADLDPFVASDGTHAARLHGAADVWGAWTQCARVEAWMGQNVTIRARMRTAGTEGGGAGLWLRIDDVVGEGRSTLAFSNSADARLLGDTGWTDVAITLPVAAEADTACFGHPPPGDRRAARRARGADARGRRGGPRRAVGARDRDRPRRLTRLDCPHALAPPDPARLHG